MNLSLDAQSQRFLADLARLSTRQSKVERQLSSGYAVDNPSDSPEKVVDIVQLRSDVERASAIANNLDRIKAEVDSGEAAVSVAVNLLERARTLAAQAASTTAANRTSAAQEARELHQQLVNLTKTMSEGRYVFSGDSDQIALYSADWSQSGGFVRNARTTNTRQIEDVYGGRFSVAQSASEIFDTRNADDTFAADNSFNAVYQLGKALENDDPAAVENASTLISASLDRLGKSLTFYGNIQNRVATATNLTEKSLVSRRTELAELRETDLPTAVLELSTLKIHQDAALGAQAQINRKSLFDYLG